LDKQLPADLQGQLNALQDVAGNTVKLKKLIKTDPDLAILYRQERDRLVAEASDRKKGCLPKLESDEYNTELGNLAESICHAPNSKKAAEDTQSPSASGKIKQFFSQFFN